MADRTSGRYMAAAYSMTGSVLGIGALGYFLDRQFGWNNYGLIGGIFLGVFVGMYELYKSVFVSKDEQ